MRDDFDYWMTNETPFVHRPWKILFKEIVGENGTSKQIENKKFPGFSLRDSFIIAFWRRFGRVESVIFIPVDDSDFIHLS